MLIKNEVSNKNKLDDINQNKKNNMKKQKIKKLSETNNFSIYKSTKINKDLKITKKMTFNELIQKNPESVMVLLERGMHCIGCGMAGFETLEQGAIAHGLDPDELVKELNGEDNKSKIKKNKPRVKKHGKIGAKKKK